MTVLEIFKNKIFKNKIFTNNKMSQVEQEVEDVPQPHTGNCSVKKWNCDSCQNQPECFKQMDAKNAELLAKKARGEKVNMKEWRSY